MTRTILVAGPCGAGKSSIARLGYNRLTELFGPTAAIDTDTMLMMIDPRWELPWDDHRGRLASRQINLLADSFFDFGVETLLVVGNALHTRESIDFLLPGLLARGEVFHVLLDPTMDVIQRRTDERGDNRDPDWVRSHVTWVRDQTDGWTHRIDNTTMTPDETAVAIAHAVQQRAGELITQPGAARPTPNR